MLSAKKSKGQAQMDPIKLFAEMRRRNVFRVTGAYFVSAWVLVQIAFTLESVMQLPEWFDALFMSLMILGAPVVIILAWAFELTPEGFKRTESISKENSIAAQTGRKLEIAIIIGLVTIGGLLIADRIAPAERVQIAKRTSNHSVAVLPFSNRSSEANDAFFADGIHDDLLTRLSKVSAFEVISRTSVMGYRDTEKRIPEIATELDVAVILEGAVQRSGDRVRITVQLIDGSDDKHLWAENYDRALTTDNIFDIQAEITQVIATALESVITGEDQSAIAAKSTENLAAYEAYIQCRLLMRPDGNKEEDLERAIELADKAISLDPEFTDAYAVKAYAQMAQYWFNGRNTVYRDAALGSLSKAKELFPDSPDTLLSEAYYYYWGFQDFRKADGLFDRALKQAPNNIHALSGKAFIARRLGRFKEAANDLAKARRLDPKTFYLMPELGLTYALIGEFDKANEMVAKAKALQPDSLQGAVFAAAIVQFQGDAIGAHKALESTGTIFQQQKMNYAIATRNPVKINKVLEEWPEKSRAPADSPHAYKLSKIRGYLAMGEDVTAELAALKEATTLNSPSTDWAQKSAYSPVMIPSLLGDKKAVEILAESYETQAPDDALIALTHLGELAESFARLGEFDKAMDYAERMRDMTGPHIYLLLRMEPGFDALREHPRYLKLKADYETWNAKQTG